jgi:hypothetical protein
MSMSMSICRLETSGGQELLIPSQASALSHKPTAGLGPKRGQG